MKSASKYIKIGILFLSLFTFCLEDSWADSALSRTTLQKVLDQVKFYRLSNGIRVILYRRGVAPVFAGTVTVRVGGSDESVGQTGISHMLEHMAFKGTKTTGTSDYSRERKLLAELEVIAARTEGATKLEGEDATRWQEIHQQLGAIWKREEFSRNYQKRGASGLNATTDSEFTKYFANFPRSSFDFWCENEADRLKNPVMRQFYQERDVVMEERRMRFDDSPEGKLYEQLLGVSFLIHPYRNPVIGYERDIRKVTATMVADFHRRFYVPDNIVVSVVGDVNPEEDIKRLERCFGSLPPGPAPTRPDYVEPPQRGERALIVERNASPQLIVSYRKPQYPDADDPRLSVMLEIFSGSSISPLYETLVKREQVAASVSHEEAPGIAYPNLLIFQMPVKQPHSTDDVLRTFDAVLERFKKSTITDEQLEIAKRSLSVGYLGGLRTNTGLALDLASAELVFNDWRTILAWNDQVMAVTKSDVIDVARKYLIPSARVVARIERGGEE